ncbi:MAG: CoA-binding protein [Candidatus Lustribacter sp.]|jgi:predicted CoA-binding protein
MIVATDQALRELLERSKTVAVVGASANAARPSKGVFDALVQDGRFAPAPINPTLTDIDGIPAFPTLEAYAAAHGAPDIVDVFRNPADAPEVTREAIAAGAKAIWFQLGVVNDAAIAAADAAGLDVVVDRCIKIEIARLLL